MDISVLRDLVIVIGGFLFLVVIILAGIFGFILYRDIRSLTKLVKDTIQTAKELGPNVKQSTGFFKMIVDTIRVKKTAEESKAPGGKTA